MTRVPSASPFAASIGFSAAVRAGDRVVTAGMTALDAGDDAGTQAAAALRKALDALAEAGATPEDVVRTRIYLRRRGDWEAVGRAHAEVLGHVRPAATMVVCELLDSRMLVEVELEAFSPQA